MNRTAADGLIVLIGNLVRQHNELAIKVGAAEKVFHDHSQHLYDQYRKEIDALSAAANRSPLADSALALDTLRQALLRD
jgi:hypothetical protein